MAETTTRPETERSDLWQRILVTLLVLAAYRLAATVPIPGLNPDVASSFLHGPGSGLGAARLSVAALGVTPIVSALILAELVLILLPFLRDGRATDGHGPGTRKVTSVLALLFAAFQGYGVSLGLEGVDGLVASPGTEFRAGVMGTCVAATALLMLLADLVTRRGIGSGVWVLFLVPALADAASLLPAMLDTSTGLPPESLLAVLLYTGLGIAALVAVERAEPGLAATGQLLWPPLLAGALFGWMILPLYFAADLQTIERVMTDLSPGHWPHIAGLLVLVPVFALVRAQSLKASGMAPSARSLAASTAVLTALVAGGALLAMQLHVQLLADGVTLAVLMSVVLTCWRGERALPRQGSEAL